MKYLIAGVFLAFSTAAFAHSGVQDPDVKARMDGMSAIAVAVKSLGAMLKGEAEFDAAAVDAALQEIEARAARIPSRFETAVVTPKSEARPVIWQQFDDFGTKARDLQILAAESIGTVDTPDGLAPLMRDIGENCKSCHSAYRE